MWLIHSPSPSVRGVPCFSRTNLFSFILSGLISHLQSGQFPPNAMCVKCLCVLNTFWKKSVCGPACVSSKAEAFKGPAWVSCAIFYQDCISGSVCLTLPVRSWIKTGCCCQACFHSKYSSSPLWLPFYRHSPQLPFSDLPLPSKSPFHGYDF